VRKTELRNELFSKLSSVLKPYDFTLVRGMDWFVRKGRTKLIYGVTFYDGFRRDMGYTISPSLAIRIDEVEQIYHQVSGYEPKYQKVSVTIDTSIQELRKRDRDYEYALDTYEDINPLTEELFAIFKNIALPFLEENSSIIALNSLLNHDPKDPDSIFCIPQHRFFRGVILAKLANDDRFDYISEIYRSAVEQFLPEYIPPYDQLLKILKAI